MGGNLSSDHDLLAKFLDAVLDRYKDGMISHSSARSALAEAIALAADVEGGAARHMQTVVNHDPRGDL